MQIFRQRTREVIEPSKPADLVNESVRTFFSGRWIDRAKVARVAAQSYRRLIHFLRWIGPVIALIALPKCPMCLVGYIALITGASISIAVAETLQTAVMIGLVALLAWLVFQGCRRGFLWVR